MKKLLATLVLIFAVLPGSSLAQSSVNNFVIRSFEADYYLSRDDNKTSHLSVTEKITAEFPTSDQNHGIKRAIPKEYQGHTVSLSVESVTDASGRELEYDDSTENENLVLKIGDPNEYVHGLQTYVIKYKLKNVINFQDSDEFYWDINGTEWGVPFDKVVGRIHLPSDIASAKEAREACFSGYAGSTGNSCTVMSEPEGSGVVVTVASTLRLNIRENISVVLGFDKGAFQLGPEIQAEKDRQRNLIIAAVAVFVAPIIIAATFMINRWRKFGRDPAAKTAIVPEYIPPKDFNALKSEMILQEKIRPAAVTATILELAVSHYLVIHEITKKKIFKDAKEFELEIVKDTNVLPVEQRKVLDEIFSNNTAVGQRINLSTLKNKLFKTVQELDKSLGDSLAEAGYFRGSPHKVKKGYQAVGGVLMFFGFLGFFFLPLLILTGGLFIAGLIVLGVAGKMPARTSQGVEMRIYLEGLKEYMKLAEQERMEFSQGLNTAERFKANPTDPAEKIKLFERLLPYSVLFGLDKDWAKEFADLYNQPPSWYTGNSAVFNAAYLSSSLGSFNAAAATAFSAPSNSGGSGFSGGGFSGGGGGGGGGGGW